jgi:hypothetical protein
MNKLLLGSAALFATLAVTGTAPWAPPGALPGMSAPPSTAVAAPASAIPGAGPALPFIENRGQLPDGVVFHAPSARAGTYVTADGEILYALPGTRLTERFAGGSASPAGVERAPTRVASFVGNDPSRWTSDAATWNTVGFGEVWPGVVVDLHARQGSVEKFFTVTPGATPERIRMEVDGAEGLSVADDGRLMVALPGGEVAFSAPIAFQEVDGERRPVRVAYAAQGLGYGFEVGAYDRSRPLVIDPTLLYSTFGGGAGGEWPNDFHVDAAGAVYVAGRTTSPSLSPGGGPFGSPADLTDGFVAKLAPGGASYEFFIFVGGDGTDDARQLELAADGSIFLAGVTVSTDLPVSSGAAQAARNGTNRDYFVTKLNANATAIQYLTYLGGPGHESPNLDADDLKLAIDGSGRAYIFGNTEAAGYPVSAGAPQATFAGGLDAVLTRVAANGTAFEFSTYLGGPGSEYSDRFGNLVVRDDGRVWIAGRVANVPNTGIVNFPTSPGAALASAASPAVFAASYDTSAGTRRYATLVGGNDATQLSSMAVDGAGRQVIAGNTRATNLPVTVGAYDGTLNGNFDGFVSVLTENGAGFHASTYFGGSGSDWVWRFGILADGGVVVTGNTDSTNLPVTAGAYRPTPAGTYVARFSSDLSALAWSTYIDSGSFDTIRALEVDAGGRVYLLRDTGAGNLPANDQLTAPTNNTDSHVYLAKLAANGSALLDAAYLASTEDDDSLGMHVLDDGIVYVVGATEGVNFPLTSGVADATFADQELFIAKLQTLGNAPPPATGTIAWTAASASASESGGTVTLTATRSGGSAGAVSAQYATADGTATSGSDYTAASGVLNWADGESGNKTVTISVTNDTVIEPAETFTVTLSNPAGATLGTPAAVTVTINDDDVAAPGTIAWATATASVSESGGTVTLTATRAGGAAGVASVQYATANGTATAGSDYAAASGALNWADGESGSKAVTISVTNDTVIEPAETFTVTLSNPAGATLGTPAAVTVTINDDDVSTPGTLAFSAGNYSANEGQSTVTISVTRTGGTTGAASVNYAATAGTATAGADFSVSSGTLNWADGDAAAKTFTVAILDDSADEPNETVTLTLSQANAATLGTPASATLTIVDNDAPATTVVRARGSYGGGSAGLWLFGLLGLLALGRRPGRAVAVLAVGVAASPVQAADAGWYAGARGGVATSSQDSSELNRALANRGTGLTADVDDQDFGGSVYVGYEFAGGLALEVGYVDLGEYTVKLDGDVADPSAALQDSVRLLGSGGGGFTAVARWNLRFADQFEFAPRAGLYYWDSENELRSDSVRVSRDESGTDFTGGVSLAWRPGASWSLGVAWDYYAQADRNDVNVYGLQVEYRWP